MPILAQANKAKDDEVLAILVLADVRIKKIQINDERKTVNERIIAKIEIEVVNSTIPSNWIILCNLTVLLLVQNSVKVLGLVQRVAVIRLEMARSKLVYYTFTNLNARVVKVAQVEAVV